MKKTSKEYADKLAGLWTSKDDPARNDFIQGYLKAVEETNAEGLLEACGKALFFIGTFTDGKEATECVEALQQAIKKAQ